MAEFGSTRSVFRVTLGGVLFTLFAAVVLGAGHTLASDEESLNGGHQSPSVVGEPQVLPDQDVDYRGTYQKRIPIRSSFVGMRGKKIPKGFMGMRGRRGDSRLNLNSEFNNNVESAMYEPQEDVAKMYDQRQIRAEEINEALQAVLARQNAGMYGQHMLKRMLGALADDSDYYNIPNHKILRSQFMGMNGKKLMPGESPQVMNDGLEGNRGSDQQQQVYPGYVPRDMKRARGYSSFYGVRG